MKFSGNEVIICISRKVAKAVSGNKVAFGDISDFQQQNYYPRVNYDIWLNSA